MSIQVVSHKICNYNVLERRAMNMFLWVWFREELAENYERAAAIAVFQGRIRRGIASLKDGAGVAQQQGNVTKGKG